MLPPFPDAAALSERDPRPPTAVYTARAVLSRAPRGAGLPCPRPAGGSRRPGQSAASGSGPLSSQCGEPCALARGAPRSRRGRLAGAIISTWPGAVRRDPLPEMKSKAAGTRRGSGRALGPTGLRHGSPHFKQPPFCLSWKCGAGAGWSCRPGLTQRAHTFQSVTEHVFQIQKHPETCTKTLEYR